jgi:hypothetical protein
MYIIIWQKLTVPKLFFLTLFWEFVMFFQLSISFHYSSVQPNNFITDRTRLKRLPELQSLAANIFVKLVPTTFINTYLVSQILKSKKTKMRNVKLQHK